jgi:hypothetical protein
MAQRTCEIEGCEGVHLAKGWCSVHYQRWWKHGSPLTDLRRTVKMSCEVEGCERVVRSRGWCETHYMRWWRHGGPLAGGPSPGFAVRFIWHAVQYTGSDCLEWPYARNEDGYGRITLTGRRSQSASRLVLELTQGPALGRQAAHAPVWCRNRSCVNPHHLRWATHAENMLDKALDNAYEKAYPVG